MSLTPRPVKRIAGSFTLERRVRWQGNTSCGTGRRSWDDGARYGGSLTSLVLCDVDRYSQQHKKQQCRRNRPHPRSVRADSQAVGRGMGLAFFEQVDGREWRGWCDDVACEYVRSSAQPSPPLPPSICCRRRGPCSRGFFLWSMNSSSWASSTKVLQEAVLILPRELEHKCRSVSKRGAGKKGGTVDGEVRNEY